MPTRDVEGINTDFLEQESIGRPNGLELIP